MKEFVHLKARSHWTPCGVSAPAEFVWRAASIGHPALALTDEMSLAGLPEFAMTCNQAGVRPIVGCVLYHSPISDLTPNRGTTFSLTVLVEDSAGYQTLLEALNRAKLRPQSLFPEIAGDMPRPLPLQELFPRGDGLMFFIGGTGSELREAVISGNARAATQIFETLNDIQERSHIFVEIERFGSRDDGNVEPGLLELARRWDVTPIISNNAWCSAKAQFPSHLVLERVLNEEIGNEEAAFPRLDEGDIPYLASSSEMSKKFSPSSRLWQATLDIAERCRFNPIRDIFSLGHEEGQSVDTSDWGFVSLIPHFPKLDYPRGQSEESYIWNRIFERARSRYGQISDDLKERLNTEYEAFKNAGAMPRLAFLSRLIETLDTPHFACRFKRPGMTSSQLASLVNLNLLSPFDLKVTFSLDEFTASAGRQIEMDIPSNTSNDIISALSSLIGRERLTYVGMLKETRTAEEIAAIVCRGLGLNQDRAANIAKQMIETPDGGDTGIEQDDYLEKFFDNQIDDNILHQLCTDIQKALPTFVIDHEHIAFANNNLARQLPMFYLDGIAVSQWNLEALRTAGFPTLAFCENENLTILSDTLKAVKRSAGTRAPLDLSSVPVEDRRIFALFKDVDTLLIQPLAGIESRVSLNRLQPESFSALTKITTPKFSKLPFLERMSELAMACKLTWLQVNYLEDYFLACLKRQLGRPEQMRRVLRRLRREGVPVYGPRVNISTPEPTLRDGGLQLGFAMLKGFTQDAFESMASSRREMPFSDLIDYLQRVEGKASTSIFVKSLIESGAFDIMEKNRRLLFEQWRCASAHLESTTNTETQPLFLSASVEAVKTRCEELSRKSNELTNWTFDERIEHERNACGFEITGDPIDRYRDFLDQSIIHTGPIKKRTIRRIFNLFWAGNVDYFSDDHPDLIGFEKKALFDLGEFWGHAPEALYKENLDLLQSSDTIVFQLEGQEIEGRTFFEIKWCAALKSCVDESYAREEIEIDCQGWEAKGFRTMAKLCRQFPGETRIQFKNVPERFSRKAARLQGRGVFYTPTLYKSIPPAQ